MHPKRRELARLLAVVGAAPLLARLAAARAQFAPLNATPRLGINIAAPRYYNTELPFVDLFRTSREWEVKRTDGVNPATPISANLDADGWITHLDQGTWAETPLAVLGHLPQGVWTVSYEGAGRIEVWGDHLQVVSEQAGLTRFAIKPHTQARLWLRLWRTDPANHVRRIRVLMPGTEGSHSTFPWNPSFLKRWQGMAALRYMDMMATNNSAMARWSERPRPEHATFAGKGVAVELLVDLANRLHSDPWFCMPHLADDDYVRNFAALVRDRLDPDLHVYVEYSNETWNSIFQQHRHVVAAGRALGLAPSDLEAGLRYTARRAAEMFDIWSGAVGDSLRLVPVLASQAANPWTAATVLEAALGKAGAIAIAPYVSLTPSPVSTPSATEVGGWSLEQLFSALEALLLAYERTLAANLVIANRHRLKLIAYEGGQHLVGIHGGENDARLTSLFHAANRDSRMEALYRRMYGIWEAAGGDLFCHFSSVNPNSKWGSWGLLEHHDDDPLRSPKFVESMRWAARRGQHVAYDFN